MKRMARIRDNFIKIGQKPNKTTVPKVNTKIRKQKLYLIKSTVKKFKIRIRCREKYGMAILEVRQKERIETIPDHTISRINLPTLMQEANLLRNRRSHQAKVWLKVKFRIKGNTKQFQ